MLFFSWENEMMIWLQTFLNGTEVCMGCLKEILHWTEMIATSNVEKIKVEGHVAAKRHKREILLVYFIEWKKI